MKKAATEEWMANLKNSKILIVEDEISSSLFLSVIFQDLTKEILHAKTGSEAVELCKINTDINLILMDVKMPVMDGYEATRRIREFNKDVKIVAQTAYAYVSDREQALKVGCNDYIAKPISKEHIIQLVGRQFE